MFANAITLSESELAKWKKAGWMALMTILAIIAITYLVLLYFHICTVIVQETPLADPTENQKKLLKQANELICKIDIEACNAINSMSIEYRIIDQPAFVHFGRLMHIFHEAYTYQTNTGYVVALSSHIFSDLSATTVFAYHELMHAYNSDFILYVPGQDEYKRCLDHNLVKNATTAFSQKFEAWLATEEGSNLTIDELPSFYAKQHGNRVEDCG